MVIRPAALSDVQELTVLTQHLGYSVEAASMFDRLGRILAQPNQLIIVGVIDGTLAGWLQACTSDVLGSEFRAEIIGLVVADRFRRRRVGRSLVETAERWAQDRGAR